MNSDPASGPVSVAADPESPWLGLRSFTEETQSYFFGRADELQDLFERVLHKPLTVLFGQSGLGKTSLIQAGLLPRLREEAYLPVRMRLRYEADAPAAGAQMVEALREALQSNGLTDLLGDIAGAADLWLVLHDPSFGFIDRVGVPLIRPVFIFDQFEEIFTLGVARRAMADEFRETLAAIVENRMPPQARALLEEDEELADRIDYHAHPAKVLLSLREDYLHLLERWRRRLPALMDNRMELRPLSGVQALQAVTEPGSFRPGKPPIVSREVAASVVRFVAGAGSDVPLAEIDTIPPLLSLMCAELNSQRRAAGEETIAAGQLEGRSEQILDRFYDHAFADQPPAIREFVEERLLSESGHRQAVTFDTAEAELARRAGLSTEASSEAIGRLVQERLLVVEERGGVRRVELTHDVLTSVASASRARRRERETTAKITARQHARLRRQRAIASAVVAALLIGCAVLGSYAYRARQATRYRELLDSGDFMLQSGKYEPALVNFKEAVRIRPSEAEGWFGLGDVLVRQAYGAGDARNTPILLEAIGAYQKALGIAQTKGATAAQHHAGAAKLAQAYVGLGDVYALGTQPDFSQASGYYTKAEGIDPASPDPHIGYGNIRMQQGQFHAALAEYDKALKAARERNTPSYGAQVGAGSAYFYLGHYVPAIDAFNRAIGANPASLIARFRLASALSMNDRADTRAKDLFESLLGSNLKRLKTVSRMNLAYTLLERESIVPDRQATAKAITYLREAHEEDPYVFSTFRLGIGFAVQGNAEEATRLWREAITLPWGSDALDQQTYAPLLESLLGQAGAMERFREIAQRIASEGGVGFLEVVARDVALIRRSGLFPTEANGVNAILEEAIAAARQKNAVDTLGTTAARQPPGAAFPLAWRERKALTRRSAL